MEDLTVIDGILDRFESLLEFLDKSGEVSLALEADANFKKLLVLACGSFFEEQVTSMIERFVARYNDARLVTFVRRKALERQYHSLFDWDASNANKFFAFFGDQFKDAATKRLQADQELQKGMRSFMRLGQSRNVLAHGNLAANAVDGTREELVNQYREAVGFLRFLQSMFDGTVA